MDMVVEQDGQVLPEDYDAVLLLYTQCDMQQSLLLSCVHQVQAALQLGRELEDAMEELKDNTLGIADWPRYRPETYAFTPSQQQQPKSANPPDAPKKRTKDPAKKKRKKQSLENSLNTMSKQCSNVVASINAYATSMNLKPNHSLILADRNAEEIGEEEAREALELLKRFQQQRHRVTVTADQEGAFMGASVYSTVVPMQVGKLVPNYYNSGATDEFTAECVKTIIESYHNGTQKRNAMHRRELNPNKRQRNEEEDEE